MRPTLIYCYDAYCGWCYGFSEVMKKIQSEYKDRLEIEVLSGGMILPDEPVSIGATAGYISKGYKRVEELTGIKFGEDYLWHINHPDQSDWYPNSEKSAIALCIFKEYYPHQQVSFAADLQYATLQMMKAIAICWKNIIYRPKIFMACCMKKNTKRKPIMNSPCANNYR